MIKTKCPICNSTNNYLLFNKYSRHSQYTFYFQKCRKCDFIWVLNPLNKNFYTKEYYQGRGIDKSVNYVQEMKKSGSRNCEYEGLARLIENLQPNKPIKIFDIGCGTGGLLKYLSKKKDYSLYGFDVNPFITEGINKNIRYFSDIKKAIKACKGKMDIIIAVEVLEHVQNPSEFAATVDELLAKGGVFIYTTGNSNSIMAKIYGKKWPFILPEIHLSYFTPKTMVELFSKYKMEVLPNHYSDCYEQIMKYRFQKSVKFYRGSRILHLLGCRFWLLNILAGISDFPFFRKK